MTNQAQPTIGIIGGLGWLGSALVEAILTTPALSEYRIVVSSRTEPKIALPERVSYVQVNQQLVDISDLVVLSVRPQDWPEVNIDLSNKMLVSFMAGISCHALSREHNTAYVVRALPNAAISVKQSYTPWFSLQPLTDAYHAQLNVLLSAIGTYDQYKKEDDLDVLTAISGAGPAYPALLSSALVRSAIELGLPEQLAIKAVNATLKGSAALIENLTDDPQRIVSVFEEYQGTTTAGLKTMQEEGFINSIDLGVNAAYQKAKDLNK